MQGPFTRIVLCRPNGRTEIVTRQGHIEPNAAARIFAVHGKVVTVRHETPSVTGGRSRLVTAHNMKR